MVETADAVVIGGGIAGASAAYALAAEGMAVRLLERESACGYHSTGRSAASFTENYGNGVIRRLAKASRAFLTTPPDGFSATPLVSPRGTITIASEDALDALDTMLTEAVRLAPSIRRIDPADARAAVPILRAEAVAGAILEPDAMELDVAALHQGYLAALRRLRGRVDTGAEALAIERTGGVWRMRTRAAEIEAPLLVNAAGAWADVVAALAGVPPVGLTPKRRTAFLVKAPDGVDPRGWPMVDEVRARFYFKTDAGRIFVSPADATPVEPQDVQPEELDIAIGAERFEAATTVSVRRIERSWAGLRSFVADGSPVVGLDPQAEGFFWVAAQGGYGIKTAPALSALVADLAIGRGFSPALAALGLSAADLSPERCRAARS